MKALKISPSLLRFYDPASSLRLYCSASVPKVFPVSDPTSTLLVLVLGPATKYWRISVCLWAITCALSNLPRFLFFPLYFFTFYCRFELDELTQFS